MENSSKLRFINPENLDESGNTDVKEIDERTNYIMPNVIAIHKPSANNSTEFWRQSLPVFQHRTQFLYSLEKSRVVVVAGETGSGKSTQIPQYVYEAGWLDDDNAEMLITQPRRIAAVTLAKKVAEEKNCQIGTTVGYNVRFERCYQENKTKITYVTEGILIRELLQDPLLSKYRVIMLDEVHERTICTDLLVGLLKLVLRQRRDDLRLIVSSATLNAEKLLKFYSKMKLPSIEKNKAERNLPPEHDCVAIQVEGRQYPVEIFYRQDPISNYVDSSFETVINIHNSKDQGDILVFLTGQEEVLDLTERLTEYSMTKLMHKKGKIPQQKMEVLPLFSNMPPRDQMKVFDYIDKEILIGHSYNQPRRVIVSTNIAETSVTVPGIGFVVDCGFTKTVTITKQLAIPTLITVAISKASANQRAGRAGRICAGKVFRLYTENDFNKLPDFSPPEIVRCELSRTILEMKSLGIDKIVKFPFLSAPPINNLKRSLETLYALGCLDDNANLTEKGQIMTELPLHPMAGAMLLASANEEHCSAEASAVAALMQVNNIFVCAPNQRRAFEKAQRVFACVEGDHITQLNALRAFEKLSKKLDKQSLSSWCGRNFINKAAAYKALAIRDCLRGILLRHKLPWVSCGLDVQPLVRAIVKGFYAQAARLSDNGTCYRTIAGDHQLDVHPNSVVHRLQWEVISTSQSKASLRPSWVVFTNLVATGDGHDCMDSVTVITADMGGPKLLEELAPHYYSQSRIVTR